MMRLFPILAFAAAMASAQNAPKPVNQPLMIVHNPNGTFTIRKEPTKSANAAKATQGLVIPPQVVVPLIPSSHRQALSGITSQEPIGAATAEHP